jgi:hypothetical protein
MLRSVLIDVVGTLWPDRWPPSAKRLYVRRLSEELEVSAATPSDSSLSYRRATPRVGLTTAPRTGQLRHGIRCS